MPYPNHPLRAPLHPKRQPPKAPFYTLMSPNAATFPGGMSVREAWADRLNKIQDLDGTDGPVIKPSPGRDRELMNILDFMESKDRTLDDVAPNPDKGGNGVSLLDSPDEGTWSKIKELATNILDYMPSIMSESEAGGLSEIDNDAITEKDLDLDYPKTNYTSQVIRKIGKRLKRDARGLNKFADGVSAFESDSGRNIQNPESTARGIYQFTKDSIPTAINRLTKVLGYKPQEIKDFQKQSRPNYQSAKSADIAELSPDLQRALFLAHLSESPTNFKVPDEGSDILINSYLDGDDVGEELFIKHHYKGDPNAATKIRLGQKKWF